MPLTARQSQTLLWSAIAAFLAIALLTLGPVLTPFVTAAILAYVLEPGVRWLDSHKTPRALAVLITLTTSVLVVLLILLILVPIDPRAPAGADHDTDRALRPLDPGALWPGNVA